MAPPNLQTRRTGSAGLCFGAHNFFGSIGIVFLFRTIGLTYRQAFGLHHELAIRCKVSPSMKSEFLGVASRATRQDKIFFLNPPRNRAMKVKLLLLTAALSCAFSSASFAMTKVEYTTQKDTITGAYKVSRDKCNSLKANAKDICISEANGLEKIAKAELEASYEPSDRHNEKVAMAKGDAAYDTAKEKCDDSSGNAKTVCRADAKAAHVKANEEARVVRVDGMAGSVQKSMRDSANKDENQANYKAAITRCDGMSGGAKDTCNADAKVKFGIK